MALKVGMVSPLYMYALFSQVEIMSCKKNKFTLEQFLPTAYEMDCLVLLACTSLMYFY